MSGGSENESLERLILGLLKSNESVADGGVICYILPGDERGEDSKNKLETDTIEGRK